MGRVSSESSRSRYNTPMPNSSPISGKFSAAHQGTLLLANSYINCDRAQWPSTNTPWSSVSSAAASGWNEPSLITAFRQGLNPRLKSHLAAYDDTHGLEKFIQLAIRCSNRINIRPTDSTPAPAIVTPPNHQPEARDQPEAMLTDMFRLTPAERRRRLTRGLCLYCGGEDHRIQTCILRPPRLWVSGIQPVIPKMNPLTTCAHLIIDTICFQSPSSLIRLCRKFISGSLCQAAPSLDHNDQGPPTNPDHNRCASHSSPS